jgi:glycosyltransferase involved in cell wall biosynthesis
MRILYLNHYVGGPTLGMEYRPYYLAREWVKSGHSVRMVGASYSHVRSAQPRPPSQGASRWNENVDGIEFRWVRTPSYVGNGMGRVVNIAAFLWRVWTDARTLVSEFKPDVVIASSTYPMDIWVARRIARLARARLVFEVHDLWPLSPIELNGMSPRHPFILLCSAAETAAYRDADVVVSMLPRVDEYMASRGLDVSKLAIVPNGVPVEEVPVATTALPQPLRAVLDAARAQGRTLVGYTGSHGLPNALDVLMNAASQLRDEPFTFVMVGDGHEKARLVERAAARGLTHVHWVAPIAKAQVPELLAALDIAYIGWQRTPIYRFGIAPNKLMDYMLAGCVVLHSVDAGNDPVAESGCGLSVAPESPDAVADGLRRLAAVPLAQRREMGRRGRDHVLAHHTYPVLARRFLDALSSKSQLIHE